MLVLGASSISLLAILPLTSQQVEEVAVGRGPNAGGSGRPLAPPLPLKHTVFKHPLFLLTSMIQSPCLVWPSLLFQPQPTLVIC